ncbi:MAG: hypothetical protein GTO18_20080 [Anaerolineales bacterium]|nr:hypothetical protein [Anaerolineales bacterium]
MDVSRSEAQEALEAVQQVMAQTRRELGRGSFPYYMILWGVIWFLGYLASYFIQTEVLAYIWAGLGIVGVGVSIYLGIREGSRVRSPLGRRHAYLWLAIIIYSMVILVVANPEGPEQASTLFVLAFMFGYVALGLFVEPAALWVGLAVSAATLVGYYLLLPYYALWMAFLGGGTLIMSGIYVIRRWR